MGHRAPVDQPSVRPGLHVQEEPGFLPPRGERWTVLQMMEGLWPAVAGWALWTIISDMLGFLGAQDGGAGSRGQGPPFLVLGGRGLRPLTGPSSCRQPSQPVTSGQVRSRGKVRTGVVTGKVRTGVVTGKVSTGVVTGKVRTGVVTEGGQDRCGHGGKVGQVCRACLGPCHLLSHRQGESAGAGVLCSPGLCISLKKTWPGPQGCHKDKTQGLTGDTGRGLRAGDAQQVPRACRSLESNPDASGAAPS